VDVGDPARHRLGDLDGVGLRGARLDSQLASGAVLGDITDPGLDVPTTATVAAGRLWAVNAWFEIVPPTPDTKYWITQLRFAQKTPEIEA
jgi:hypothetical protein